MSMIGLFWSLFPDFYIVWIDFTNVPLFVVTQSLLVMGGHDGLVFFF